MVAATEEVAEDLAGDVEGVITADTLTATLMATTEDMDMVGGAIPMDGVILTGGIIGGTTLTIPIPLLFLL